MQLKWSAKAACVAAILGLPHLAVAQGADQRLDDLDASVMLLEEANSELRAELDRRMRVSGYTDVEYTIDSRDNKEPGFRMHHLSLFFTKNITDKWRFFSEIEFEDAVKLEKEGADVSGWGKLFVEAVNLDYLWRQEAVVRVGRFFTPAGIWSVDHYPPFVPTQERPAHIRKIFPQLVDGAMMHGTVRTMRNTFVSYNAYIGNGENNPGSGDANPEKAIGLKASLLLPIFQRTEIGGTIYRDSNVTSSGLEKSAYGVHARLRAGNVVFQSEAAFARHAGSGEFTNSGYYAQAGYIHKRWLAGYRYDNYDANRSASGELNTNSLFVNYRVSTNLVFKVEHHLVDDNGTDYSKTIGSVVAYLE